MLIVHYYKANMCNISDKLSFILNKSTKEEINELLYFIGFT